MCPTGPSIISTNSEIRVSYYIVSKLYKASLNINISEINEIFGLFLNYHAREEESEKICLRFPSKCGSLAKVDART
jgi:hypothetical protein